MTLLLPGLRRIALRAPISPFACRPCLRPQVVRPRQPPSPSPSRILRLVRHASTVSPVAGSQVASTAAAAAPAKAAWPETSSNSVGYWLIGSAVSVFGIVVFGGLTRLTESGYVPLLPLATSVLRADRPPACPLRLTRERTQTEYHRMETRHGLAAASLPGRLGIRVR